ncbi:hypothetical protein AaE_009439 [Aphanomyces astaci]|uniref:SAM domain-containing protein n=1 Tax=Aphanomyces astaci TaxID=112090 RepID=A0A6A5AC90_APHAT|nr:hypothetical protein AaE_009439 [Aphanomyces astaci]
MTVVTEWTCEQVVLWLGEAGFDNFKETFSVNEITGGGWPSIDDSYVVHKCLNSTCVDVLSTLTNEILRDDLKIWASSNENGVGPTQCSINPLPPHHRNFLPSPLRPTASPRNHLTCRWVHRSRLQRMPPRRIQFPSPSVLHRVVVLPPTNLPEIPKVGRRRFYNSKVGRDIRLNSTYPHRVLSGPKGSCVMCFSDSTSGRRRELTTTKKCLTCQVHLCAKTFGEYTTSCFEAFHEQDTLDMRARPPPRPRVMYILPNWDPAKDSYESLKRENLRMQLQHQS